MSSFYAYTLQQQAVMVSSIVAGMKMRDRETCHIQSLTTQKALVCPAAAFSVKAV
jgi:hypothetical protein